MKCCKNCMFSARVQEVEDQTKDSPVQYYYCLDKMKSMPVTFICADYKRSLWKKKLRDSKFYDMHIESGDNAVSILEKIFSAKKEEQGEIIFEPDFGKKGSN